VRLGNTILGPTVGGARSANCYMVRFSKAAKKTIAASIADGLPTRLTDEGGRRAGVSWGDYFEGALARTTAHGKAPTLPRMARPGWVNSVDVDLSMSGRGGGAAEALVQFSTRTRSEGDVEACPLVGIPSKKIDERRACLNPAKGMMR
jgi:hypothetical protein